MIYLRDYQRDLDSAVESAWHAGARNVMLVLPTGGGKTVVFAHRIHTEMQTPGMCIAIAHRQELVSQISMALAREGVRHRIVGASGLSRTCAALHLQEIGTNMIDPRGACVVAGVDTLIRRKESWFGQVKLWIMDEGHHLLQKNKWGEATRLFPNARGLGVTATPMRADGRGLGRHADGVMDQMVVGPSMSDLIRMGYLSRYRVFAPPTSSLDLSDVTIGATGDYSAPKLAKAVHRSHIHGDAVQHYLKIAPGKLGVTFCVDVESAVHAAKAYNDAGVPAEVVSAKTPDLLRAAVLRRFRAREILQLVNVDLFGEGFDLPAIEVVSMLRPTASYSLFAQQFGRALRPMEGKEHAIILDHVGNTIMHGLPDHPRQWTLDAREKRVVGPKGALDVRSCPECLAVYERFRVACPFCEYRPEPLARSAPEQVDGNLVELSSESIEAIQTSIRKVDGAPFVPKGAAPHVEAAMRRRHGERQEAQHSLRHRMMLWGGKKRADGLSIEEAQKLFFLTYGVDVLSAQALGRPGAEDLEQRIEL